LREDPKEIGKNQRVLSSGFYPRDANGERRDNANEFLCRQGEGGLWFGGAFLIRGRNTPRRRGGGTVESISVNGERRRSAREKKVAPRIVKRLPSHLDHGEGQIAAHLH